MRENLKFVIRVTCIHCMTYVLCGIIFSALFHYDELYQQGTIKYFMRPVDSFSTLLGPAFQTVRGLLFLHPAIVQGQYSPPKTWLAKAMGHHRRSWNCQHSRTCPMLHRRNHLYAAAFGIPHKGCARTTDSNTSFLIPCCKSREISTSTIKVKKAPDSTGFCCLSMGPVLSLRCNSCPDSSFEYKRRNDRFRCLYRHAHSSAFRFFRQQVVSVRSFPSEAYCFSTLLLYGARCHTDLIQPIGRFPVCFFPYAWNQCDFCHHSVLYQLHGLPPQ